MADTKLIPPKPLNSYKNPEDEPPQQAYASNQQWAKSGPYATRLSPQEEQHFQQWVRTNKVPWQDGPSADYDMRGYWQALQQGKAKQEYNSWDHTMHFPDTWKTPYSGTFSRESMYATPRAPQWKGDVLVTGDGRVVTDETPVAQTNKVIPMFAPDGTVRDVPADQLQAALAAGGEIAVEMRDPQGTDRWVPEHMVPAAKKAGGTITEDEADTPNGLAARIFGENPVSDTFSNAWEHAKGAVTGPYEAFAAPSQHGEPGSDPRDSRFVTPLARALYRATAEPTVNAFRETYKQWKAKNYGVGKEPYDEQGNYKPTVESSLSDALPIAGPMIRGFANDAEKKGIVPALAGLGVDVGAQLAAGELPRLPAILRRGKAEILAPTATLNKSLPGETMTAKERFIASKKMGLNFDKAQATNATVPRAAKNVTEHGLVGSGPIEDNNAANVDALYAHVNALQDAIAPKMTPENFGNMVQQALKDHQDFLAKQAGHGDLANSLLNKLTPKKMGREQFGNLAKQRLIEDQQHMNKSAGEMFDNLTNRVGDRQPNPAAIKTLAKRIIDENQAYYAKHPQLLKGGTKQAWDTLQDLAGNRPVPESTEPLLNAFDASGNPITDKSGKPVTSQVVPQPHAPDTWSDLHRLRSDLMDIYRSPDLVGSRAEGWLKQMTGAIDDTMTGSASRLRPADRKLFRDANELYQGMKDTYDNPQSKLYHVVRAPDGLTAANTLAELTPEVARKISYADHSLADAAARNQQRYEPLMPQLQRQTVERMLDPSDNKAFDFEGFSNRFDKAEKNKLGGILGSDHLQALQDLADKTSEQGPYDRPGTTLHGVLNAKDGTAAAKALEKPSPADVRQLQTAAQDLGDEDLIPQLQRHVVSTMINPASNELPDLKNFPSRYGRAEKEQLGGVLEPQQLDDLSDLASVSRAVNLDANPSGSGKLVQKIFDASSIPTAIGSGMTEAVLGHPIAGAITAAVPVATLGAQRAIAKSLINPETTEELMAPRPPVPKNPNLALMAGEAAIQQHSKPNNDPNGYYAQGVSQPPNEGQVLDVDKAEPNEVPAPPEGATHEVLHSDGKTLLGHVIDGQYQPLPPPGAQVVTGTTAEEDQ